LDEQVRPEADDHPVVTPFDNFAVAPVTPALVAVGGSVPAFLTPRPSSFALPAQLAAQLADTSRFFRTALRGELALDRAGIPFRLACRAVGKIPAPLLATLGALPTALLASFHLRRRSRGDTLRGGVAIGGRWAPGLLPCGRALPPITGLFGALGLCQLLCLFATLLPPLQPLLPQLPLFGCLLLLGGTRLELYRPVNCRLAALLFLGARALLALLLPGALAVAVAVPLGTVRLLLALIPFGGLGLARLRLALFRLVPPLLAGLRLALPGVVTAFGAPLAGFVAAALAPFNCAFGTRLAFLVILGDHDDRSGVDCRIAPNGRTADQQT
jgi:hypothetical protein